MPPATEGEAVYVYSIGGAGLMPDEREQRALDQIKAYLDAGHSLDAVREAGWAAWIDHLEAQGYDLRTGRLKIAPPADIPPPPAAEPRATTPEVAAPAPVTTVTASSTPVCERCGTERVGTRPYCVKCAWKWPEGTPAGPTPETNPLYRSKWAWAVVGLMAVFIALIVVGTIVGGSGDNGADNSNSAVLGATEESAQKDVAANATQTVAATRGPTNTPRPTPKPTPTAEPIRVQGFGQYATDSFLLPNGIFRATFTHNGNSNFIVYAYQGSDQNLLVNAIGAYQGSRPLVGPANTIIDIDADGAWTFTIEPIGTSGHASFSGSGDAVSGVFSEGSDGPWEITHAGRSNFVVWLHCAGGSALIQNEIGPVSASRVVRFQEGPCFWEVEADGSWSLSPR